MTPWLFVQLVYAAAAWYLAATAVARLHALAVLSGRSLAATVRELRARGRAADVARLGESLAEPALEPLLSEDTAALSAEELVAASQLVLDAIAPPVRLLRSLATIGTMLGLLSAVATLLAGVHGAGVQAMEHAAGGAFDSAVVGFVTALPCWTAVALCRQRTRQAYAEMDGVVLALRAEPSRSAPGGGSAGG